jgi:23S rRNA pseudouridine1911/1915/1917 synthase
VPAELEGPVDRALRTLFDASWGKARGWIEGGKVRVGGAMVTEATARVRAGAEITLDESARRPRPKELEDGDVVHLDAHVIVVAKPPGISTIPYEGSEETDTLDARVRAWLERHHSRRQSREPSHAPSHARSHAGSRTSAGKAGGDRGRGRPALGIVHRLDKETSGLVVFTRSWLAKQALTTQFRQHTVHRRYLTIANGVVVAGTRRSFLLEDRGDGLRGSARGNVRGSTEAREAITHVMPLEALPGATLVACRLETGRTHQIRIHMSESGHPVLGERVYIRGFAGPLLPAPRLMLHATELGFVHPATERPMQWELPMPDDMRAVIARLKG